MQMIIIQMMIMMIMMTDFTSRKRLSIFLSILCCIYDISAQVDLQIEHFVNQYKQSVFMEYFFM